MPFTTKANGYGPSDGYKDTKSLINADQIELNIISPQTQDTVDKAEGHKSRHLKLVSSSLYCLSRYFLALMVSSLLVSFLCIGCKLILRLIAYYNCYRIVIVNYMVTVL